MTTTISIKLMGGLGNQLFQIFATISYGLEYTCNIVLPYTEFSRQKSVECFGNKTILGMVLFAVNNALIISEAQIYMVEWTQDFDNCIVVRGKC